jgi:hypothetical protein
MHADEALAQVKFDHRGTYLSQLVLRLLPELIPPYPGECTLTANEDVLVVVIISPLLSFFLQVS